MSTTAILGLAQGAWAFLTSPLGRIVGLALIGLTLYGVGHYRGAAARDLYWRTAQLQAEIDAKQRDLDQADIAADDDDAALAAILKHSSTNRERIDAFKAEIAKRGDVACRLNAGDLAVLRLDEPDAEICGRAPAGAQGVATRAGAVVGRDCKAVLADYVGTLREANARICAGADWYRGVKKRYREAPLR